MRLMSRGPWRIVVADDDEAASFHVSGSIHWTEIAGGAVPPQSGPVRAMVEIRRMAGGMLPIAVVGGEMRTIGGKSVTVRVEQSAEMTFGEPKLYISVLERSLVPGLPPEFAQAVLDGIVRAPAEWGFGVEMVVDRGAYDDVNSSAVAFERAGGLLALMLLARLRGSELTESDLPLFSLD